MQFIEIQIHNKTPYKQTLTETQVFQQQIEYKILRQIKQKARQVKQVMQCTHSASKTD